MIGRIISNSIQFKNKNDVFTILFLTYQIQNLPYGTLKHRSKIVFYNLVISRFKIWFVVQPTSRYDKSRKFVHNIEHFKNLVKVPLFKTIERIFMSSIINSSVISKLPIDITFAIHKFLRILRNRHFFCNSFMIRFPLCLMRFTFQNISSNQTKLLINFSMTWF